MVQVTKASRAKRSGALLFGGVLVAGLSAMSASPAFGQAQPGGAGGAAGGRGNRGNFDPTQMRQQQNDRLKELLAASDDEWKVLLPKIEKVQEYQRSGAGGRGGMALLMGGRGGQGGAGGAGGGRRGGQGGAGGAGGATPTPVSQKAQELATAVENKEAKPDEYKAKLAAYRDAVAQNKSNLQKAQGELKELVTVRQEAVLVAVGYLE